ncbi:T9SS type A sorting domain-containing protein [Fibrobacter sp. UWH4]|uniref:T9SS type A sorting domain-containing protein n=1 Tax=Fibrobacter sp. UWH4 TaxID=1896210 RepID=UPI0009213237|nr:T9SS type A sorting domain-containing protein [Fibrobacter sp. UWH4]SHL74493.1 Por secretion system C-terminal sorting domain-containing protein [Fibrobacter sp. UWH4]
MKQTKFILPAVVLSAAGFAMAAGSLWNMDVDAYQVQMPDDPITCNKTTDDYTAACYSNNAGWWYAYSSGNENEVVSFDPITKNDDGTYKLIMADDDGDIIPDGNLVKDVGLVVTMSAAGGTLSAPAIAGIGFDWKKLKTEIDISVSHDGYCILYQWTSPTPLQMELSWDEDANGYDTWYAELPMGYKSLDFAWSDFKQNGWDKKPITIAMEKSVGLKIRLRNSSTTEVKGTFTLVELGWKDECSIISTDYLKTARANSAKATLTNRTLSFSGIRGDSSVEIVNLQGQVMLKGSTASAMDLSRLDAGVYMVRIAGSMNLAQKILLK